MKSQSHLKKPLNKADNGFLHFLLCISKPLLDITLFVDKFDQALEGEYLIFTNTE